MTMNPAVNQLMPRQTEGAFTSSSAKQAQSRTNESAQEDRSDSSSDVKSSKKGATTTGGVTHHFAAQQTVRKQSGQNQQEGGNLRHQIKTTKSLTRRAESKRDIVEIAGLLGVESAFEPKAQMIAALVSSSADLLHWTECEYAEGQEPALTWLALKASLHMIQDEEQKENVKEVLTEYVHEHNVEIKTSLNVADTVGKAYPEQKQLAHEMRKVIGAGNKNAYRTRDIFRELLGKFDVDSFAKSLDIYTRAIAKDLNNSMPSTNVTYLSDTLEHLRSANGARSLVLDCQDFLRNINKAGII